MNAPSNVIGSFILPLTAAMIGGANNPDANQMNAKIIYDEFRQLVGKDIRGNYVLPKRSA